MNTITKLFLVLWPGFIAIAFIGIVFGGVWLEATVKAILVCYAALLPLFIWDFMSHRKNMKELLDEDRLHRD